MKRLWTLRAAAGAAGVRAVSIRSLAAGIAVVVAGLAVLAVPAFASTTITVSSGACSGGGTLFCFTPESASGTTGSAVVWTNQSSNVGHTVTVCTTTACPGAPANSGSNSFDLTLAPANGSTAQFTFSSAGTYYYYCKIHGYAAMHGAVAVSAPSTPPVTPTPSSGSSPTHNPTGVKGIGTTAPGTGAGLGGAPMLLLPLGVLLIVAGAAGRRKR